MLALRSFDRGLKLRPRVQSVSALAGFNLNKLMNDFKTFHLGEGFELGALRFKAMAMTDRRHPARKRFDPPLPA